MQQGCQKNPIKLASVLTNWIELKGEATPVTWEKTIDVIKGPLVKNNDLAMKIKQLLKQYSTRQQIAKRDYLVKTF